MSLFRFVIVCGRDHFEEVMAPELDETHSTGCKTRNCIAVLRTVRHCILFCVKLRSVTFKHYVFRRVRIIVKSGY